MTLPRMEKSDGVTKDKYVAPDSISRIYVTVRCRQATTMPLRCRPGTRKYSRTDGGSVCAMRMYGGPSPMEASV